MSRVMNLCVCRAAAIVFGLIILGPYSAAAQTVMDATTVEFTASADHNGVATDGTPLLTSCTASTSFRPAAQHLRTRSASASRLPAPTG